MWKPGGRRTAARLTGATLATLRQPPTAKAATTVHATTSPARMPKSMPRLRAGGAVVAHADAPHGQRHDEEGGARQRRAPAQRLGQGRHGRAPEQRTDGEVAYEAERHHEGEEAAEPGAIDAQR